MENHYNSITMQIITFELKIQKFNLYCLIMTAMVLSIMLCYYLYKLRLVLQSYNYDVLIQEYPIMPLTVKGLCGISLNSCISQKLMWCLKLAQFQKLAYCELHQFQEITYFPFSNINEQTAFLSIKIQKKRNLHEISIPLEI